MKANEMSPEVKIIQIFPNPSECWQGHVLGLGNDGVVYIDNHSNGDSGWNVYIEDKLKE